MLIFETFTSEVKERFCEHTRNIEKPEFEPSVKLIKFEYLNDELKHCPTIPTEPPFEH
jgi:hypothetical protein